MTAGNAGGSHTCTKTGYIQAATFTDVPTDYWAWAQVEACVKDNVVAGYGNGIYAPLVVVTRDQMAVFIARALTGGESHVPTPSGPGAVHRCAHGLLGL